MERCAPGALRPLGSTLGWLALSSMLLSGAAHGSAPTPEGTLQVRKRPTSFVGVVMASQVLDIVPQVEGRLEAVKVRLGERVAAGQLLAVLELQPFQLELAAREASVQVAQAEEARASVLLEQSRLRLAREQRLRDYSAAEALESAEHQVALSAADLQQARGRVAEAKARHAQAARSLELARLRALFPGIVTEQYIQPGMMVGLTTPVLRLVSEELRLRFAVPESASSALRLGSQVRVRLDSRGLTLTAVVDHIAPEIDPLSRHQKVE
ncbi:efflux RND transporter periplasmic adaptor subunit, partial [Hyalangium sp.]|uniref:efflux RND transporter periplasmic adaptor subunit n=1 Tax=Hyalangium sp. TaxID=2028555 RepID=UPI002D61F315